MPPTGVPGLGELADAAGKLKEVRRKGWVDRGVPDAESVADHSYRVALLAWAVARQRGLDASRALLIGLVHDLAEAEVGDETPFDRMLAAGAALEPSRFEILPPDDPAAREAKHARERLAIERLAGSLANPAGLDLRAAWNEYDQQASEEARLVKQIDRVETLRQAEEYRARQPELPVGSFRAQVAAMDLPDDLLALTRIEPR